MVNYDPYNKPEELTIGQVSESYQWLANIAASGDDDRLPYLLKWFAEVFDAIAHDKPVLRADINSGQQ